MNTFKTHSVKAFYFICFVISLYVYKFLNVIATVLYKAINYCRFFTAAIFFVWVGLKAYTWFNGNGFVWNDSIGLLIVACGFACLDALNWLLIKCLTEIHYFAERNKTKAFN